MQISKTCLWRKCIQADPRCSQALQTAHFSVPLGVALLLGLLLDYSVGVLFVGELCLLCDHVPPYRQPTLERVSQVHLVPRLRLPVGGVRLHAGRDRRLQVPPEQEREVVRGTSLRVAGRERPGLVALAFALLEAVQAEEGVPLDVLEAQGAAAEAVLWRGDEQALEEVAGRLVGVLRDLQVPCQQRPEDLARVLGAVAERQEAAHELEQDDAERPDVHLGAVALASQDLWGQVVSRPDHGEGPQRAALQLLGAAEVDQLHVAGAVEHDVLGLQVPEHHTAVVQRLQHKDDGSRVEHRLRAGEHAGNRADGGVQLAAGAVLHQEEHVIGRLQDLDKVGDERMVVLCEHLDLAPKLPRQLAVDLFHLLQRVSVAGLLVLDQVHRA
mmetsp:Transcript_20008/g.53090  ORF Transcript_20008/g.53090 Transcript_20008/m.53090 type:complete len:384 (-) Transcript_20008:1110-2261(-)